MRKIHYRNCEKCGQRFTTSQEKPPFLCWHCWKREPETRTERFERNWAGLIAALSRNEESQ